MEVVTFHSPRTENTSILKSSYSMQMLKRNILKPLKESQSWKGKANHCSAIADKNATKQQNQ